MLKDIIEESEKQFEAKYKRTFIPLFGYKNPDDGREKEVIAEHAWFNFKKELVTETAQIVAREVLSKVREGVKEKAYKLWDHYNDIPGEVKMVRLDDILSHLQSLEDEVNK